MTKNRDKMIPGTLNVLVLKCLSHGALHGYGVSRWIQEHTDEVLQVEEGVLYPALHRLPAGGRSSIRSRSVARVNSMPRPNAGVVERARSRPCSTSPRGTDAMALMDGYRRLLQGVGRRPARDARDEIDLHLQLRAEELVAGGMSPEAAAREARRRFGDAANVEGELRRVQHQIRRREGLLSIFELMLGDVKFALRTLRRRPGFAVFAIGTLALGIGGATAIFSVANGMFLKSIPGVRDSDRIVEMTQGYEGEFISLSHPILQAVRDGVDELESVAGYELVTVAIGDGEDAPLVTLGLQVTDGYFATLGTLAAAGRLFTSAEASYPNPAAVAVVSHSLWVRRFAADPGIIGQTVRFNGSPLRVIGVTEEAFHGHAVAVQFDVFVPVGVDVPGVHGPASLEYHRNGQLDVIAKLAPGATLAQASAAADARSDQYVQAIEGPEATYPLRMIPYGSVPGSVRTPVAAFLGILLLVVTLVLVITCVNITNLQLSRAAQRRREIAVRMSLGAGKGRIVSQLLIESMVVFALGAALGTLLASWAVALAAGYEPSVPLPGARIALDLAVDYRVLLFAFGLTVLSGAFSGLVPGWHAARRDPVAGLRDGLNATSGRQRARGLLVMVQVAATVVLLVVAGLFLRSFQASQRVDVGFDSSNIVVASFDMELAGYDETQGALFWQSLLERVEAIPDVESVSLAHKLPISSRSQWAVTAPGVEAPGGEGYGFALSNRRVSVDYFATLGFRIVRGRGLSREDVVGAPRVIVINETMAERVWPGQDPIGRILDNGRNQFEVVGIAADAVYSR